MITQDELKELLHYDHDTGVFTWIASSGRRSRIGGIAGSINGRGYINIGIKYVMYLAHRLVWVYVHGHEPPNEIDHINRIKNDNRLVNLRLATRSENMLNKGIMATNTSGYKGVSFNSRDKKWIVMCLIDGKHHYIGRFDTAEEASSAYVEFAEKNHGEFFSNTD